MLDQFKVLGIERGKEGGDGMGGEMKEVVFSSASCSD